MSDKLDNKFVYVHNRLFKILNSHYELRTALKRKKLSSSIKCFIINTLFDYKNGRDKVGITLRESSYSKKIIINGKAYPNTISFTYTKMVFDYLHKFGYIDLHTGGVTKYGVHKGRWQPIEVENSFIVLGERLKDLYDSVEYTPKDAFEKLENTIIVKVNGEPATFRFNEKLKLVNTMLDSYNSLSIQSKVESDQGLHDTQIYKIYTDKTYCNYGRNHMSGLGIQQLTKQQRMNLIINDKETVVYDYSCFEPSIAYTLNGETMPEDCYSIDLEGYDKETLRSIAKKCLLIMLNINSSSWEDLRASCNYMLKTDFNVHQLFKEGKIPERVDVAVICDELEKLHQPIENFMYGNAKDDTAYIGSLIADYITDYFSQRGILCLSVFDEFIIEEEYDQELAKVMVNAYEFVCGTAKNCRIKKEK